VSSEGGRPKENPATDANAAGFLAPYSEEGTHRGRRENAFGSPAFPPAVPRFPDAPAPSAPLRLIPIDISKLKWSDIRQPYPSIRPEIFELNISNAGSDRVTELTVAFRRTRGQPCSRDLEKNDGFKRFRVNLRPGDSVTLTGDHLNSRNRAPRGCE
jgi:hypothetical protein